MKKILLAVIPMAVALTAFDATAAYIPYVPKTVQPLTPSQYDQNHDGYISNAEVEVELREDAIVRAITMQKSGASEKAVDAVIMDMEDSLSKDANDILKAMDKDRDGLVEPSEVNTFHD